MKLKSLELHGFKSFEEKTQLHFDASITGVVGPNGCGKSNIVDAIRWVMGEQSAKHLRGKSMEDVIFNGTQSREAAPMASVELTFDTAGYSTPPQYSGMPEISVCRKLYRSGESEYYINRQLVRLKDVTDLFLGTGVGTKAYSIIEQGQVGQIINVKAEDRRILIEEAAGISKFKARREAALRKIEATQQNLLRLSDIVTELERQMTSLDRQARRAEKYKTVYDRLRALDLHLAALDYTRLDNDQHRLLDALKAADVQEAGISSRLTEEEARLETERLQLVDAEAELSDFQQDVFEVNNRLQVTEARLKNMKEARDRLEREAQSLAERVQEWQHEREGTATGLSQVNQSLVNADLEALMLEEAVDALEKNYAALDESSRDLFGLIESAREARHEAAQRLTELGSRKRHLSERAAELTRARDFQEKDLAEHSARFDELSRSCNDLNKNLMDIRQLKLSLTEKTSTLEEDLKHEEARIETERSELTQIKDELMTRKSRLKSLEELERNFEGYQEGPRRVLQRKATGELGPLTASVAEIIETEPRYEGAVSAVLGERIQYVVVSGKAEGISCVENLKQGEAAGRGSFVALDMISPMISSQNAEQADSAFIVGSFNNSGLKGVEGFLEDFVTIKPEYTSLKKFLFGDVLLADTLVHALDVWQSLKKPVVTYDGEVISAEGVLTGGSPESASRALLEKKREIRELTGIVQDLVTRVKEKEETCLDLTRKIKSMQADLAIMKASGHEEDVRLASQEKDVHHLKSQMDSLNHRRGQLAQLIFQSTEDLARVETELESVTSQEERLKQEESSSQAVLDAKKAEEEQARNELTRLRESLTQEKIHKAQAFERRGYLAREVDRLVTEFTQLSHDIIRSEEERSRVMRARHALSQQITHHEQYLNQTLLRKDELDAGLRERRDAFDRLTQAAAERERGLRDIRRDYQALRDTMAAENLALSEVRSHLSRLNDQMLERYKLLLSEVCEAELTREPEGFDLVLARVEADELRQKLSGLGSVNLAAIDEFNEVRERFDYLSRQRTDLEDSLQKLELVIRRINEATKSRFEETFKLVNEKFTQLFPKLFRGGRGFLQLTNPEDILATGVDLIAQPPGKKLQSITLMSGGEKALTALCLVFSIFLIKPSPFCLLDEVDAPLDEVNVDRYTSLILEMSSRTQFVMITHNKRTMQITKSMFGVTMQQAGISSLVSVNMN